MVSILILRPKHRTFAYLFFFLVLFIISMACELPESGLPVCLRTVSGTLKELK